jgi:hypothetical protein
LFLVEICEGVFEGSLAAFSPLWACQGAHAKRQKGHERAQRREGLPDTIKGQKPDTWEPYPMDKGDAPVSLGQWTARRRAERLHNV